MKRQRRKEDLLNQMVYFELKVSIALYFINLFIFVSVLVSFGWLKVMGNLPQNIQLERERESRSCAAPPSALRINYEENSVDSKSDVPRHLMLLDNETPCSQDNPISQLEFMDICYNRFNQSIQPRFTSRNPLSYRTEDII